MCPLDRLAIVGLTSNQQLPQLKDALHFATPAFQLT
jgi:hypothetical protein